jgi:hypothetical protein
MQPEKKTVKTKNIRKVPLKMPVDCTLQKLLPWLTKPAN